MWNGGFEIVTSGLISLKYTYYNYKLKCWQDLITNKHLMFYVFLIETVNISEFSANILLYF